LLPGDARIPGHPPASAFQWTPDARSFHPSGQPFSTHDDAAFRAHGRRNSLACFLPDQPRRRFENNVSTKDSNVVKITLPYREILKTYQVAAPSELDVALLECLTISRRHPVYIEMRGPADQRFLFFRGGQVYNAGAIRDGQFSELSIREFLAASTREPSLDFVCYEADDKILHSLLILFQKKPTLKLLTSLVDLDDVLDKIEEEGKSCIVTASQDLFLAVLRYEKGRVTGLCHQRSTSVSRERSLREDFLVKIYTLSAEKPLVINVYEDLLVKYATDARVIDADFRGSVTELFVSRPPVVTLEFKDKEIGHWMLDKPVFKIGRAPDNDVVIDNLAVSRLHSVIEEDKGQHYIRDCDSVNGTVVNGRGVGRALLTDGDQIQIGKHKLVFRKHSGRQLTTGTGADRFDQTVIIRTDKKAPSTKDGPPGASRPRLVARDGNGDRVFEIGDVNVTMGRDPGADIEVSGFLVAKRHAEISRENGHFVIRHIAGYRKLTVDGKPVKERILKNNDRIKIGKTEFVFEE
jgi:pSer/pThr/pTyr-binding forkhead associated (FHA) protein